MLARFEDKKLSFSSSVEGERRHSVPIPASFALPECVPVVFLSPFSRLLPLSVSPQYTAAAGLNKSV